MHGSQTKIHCHQRFRMEWNAYVRCRTLELLKNETWHEGRHLQHQRRNNLLQSILPLTLQLENISTTSFSDSHPPTRNKVHLCKTFKHTFNFTFEMKHEKQKQPLRLNCKRNSKTLQMQRNIRE